MSTPLNIISNHLNASMYFILLFDRMPDFTSVDSQRMQADAFQIFIAFDPNEQRPNNQPDIVIRGSEINVANDVRIRNARPPIECDNNAGGWGTLRGSVPFYLSPIVGTGAILTFNVPFTLLGVSGRFSYAIETYHDYGSIGNTVYGVAP